MNEMEIWNEVRKDTKEEIQLQKEKEAWENLFCAINNMGAIQDDTEKVFYKQYHKRWDELIDRARIYRNIAKLNKKYNLDEEV